MGCLGVVGKGRVARFVFSGFNISYICSFVPYDKDGSEWLLSVKLLYIITGVDLICFTHCNVGEIIFIKTLSELLLVL